MPGFDFQPNDTTMLGSVRTPTFGVPTLAAFLYISGGGAGCISTTEQHTETILARQVVELPPRRNAAADTIGIDQKWERGELLLVATRGQAYVADVVERQTVQKNTLRTVQNWGPAYAEGILAALAVGTMVVAEIHKPPCTTPPTDTGCGLSEYFVQAGALAVLIPTSVALLINVGRSADLHKMEAHDASTGTVKSYSSVEPISGKPIVLRWADGAQLSAITDAKGVARLTIPPERSAPGAPTAAVFLDGQHIRDVAISRVGGGP